MGRKVCLAVDDSGLSREAVMWAAGNILTPEDEVHLLTVVEPVPLISDEMDKPGVPWIKPSAKELSQANSVLQNLSESLKNMGISKVYQNHMVGMVGCHEGVGQAIQEYASKNSVDHLVLGSRGLGPVSRVLLDAAGGGSVSDYCMKHLHCPISIYQPRST
eukprot:TRINITY_DN83117_c0_g1_i10.p1 TRINITY_DN83117_c0_g1~~TRINITY_DN83117_c0_g1_i10.p1  ORF type:complete len:161 (-),score=20.92 TRINITY_DN83117_c0_g1_i10:70-552(-)